MGSISASYRLPWQIGFADFAQRYRNVGVTRSRSPNTLWRDRNRGLGNIAFHARPLRPDVECVILQSEATPSDIETFCAFHRDEPICLLHDGVIFAEDSVAATDIPAKLIERASYFFGGAPAPISEAPILVTSSEYEWLGGTYAKIVAQAQRAGMWVFQRQPADQRLSIRTTLRDRQLDAAVAWLRNAILKTGPGQRAEYRLPDGSFLSSQSAAEYMRCMVPGSRVVAGRSHVCLVADRLSVDAGAFRVGGEAVRIDLRRNKRFFEERYGRLPDLTEVCPGDTVVESPLIADLSQSPRAPRSETYSRPF